MSGNREVAQLKAGYALFMHRAGLEDIPPVEVPEGFRLDWYRPGDRREWVNIHVEADAPCNPSEELYVAQFGGNDRVLGERQFFLKTETGRYVGTATAWFNDESAGESLGVVHWVAVLPEYQGKGLSKPLLSAVLCRMRELGHRRAYLTTDEDKARAVNLYLSFGFIPWAWDERSRQKWLALKPKLKPGFGRIVDEALESLVSPFDAESLVLDNLD